VSQSFHEIHIGSLQKKENETYNHLSRKTLNPEAPAWEPMMDWHSTLNPEAPAWEPMDWRSRSDKVASDLSSGKSTKEGGVSQEVKLN
jgi:hypothetical protein